MTKPDLKQILSDMDNGVLVSKVTLREAVEYAIELEATFYEGWIPHDGGYGPRLDNDTVVCVKYRDGDQDRGTADDFIWRHIEEGASNNIVAYKVVK
jgi:hypothetical protein